MFNMGTKAGIVAITTLSYRHYSALIIIVFATKFIHVAFFIRDDLCPLAFFLNS
jgi:hypothetical protein